MAAPQLLGLPPVSSDLKSISPYLQRAEELRLKDPVVAYWCAYYAAQLGISLKAKDTASRTLLFELLGTLEKMKVAIGTNDAIDFEAASAAYVENFALRVFGAADDEDRKAIATRATAKKFLAAANFLEVLKVFPKTDVSDSTDQKIRYARWKAADIAKAFREGRKPDPGPPGATEDLFGPPVISISVGSPKTTSPTGSGTPSPPHTKRSSPPQSLDSTPHTPHKPPHLDPSSLGPRWGGPGDVTPGSWSTAATPGSPKNPFSAASETFYQDPESPSAKATRDKRRSGSGSSSGSGSGSGGSGSTASIGPRGGRRSSISSGSPNGKKSVHFTPSVSGGLSSTDGSVPSSPASEIRHIPPEDIYAPPVHTPPANYSEPFVPQPSAPPLPSNLANIYATPPPAVPPAPQPSTYSPTNIYASSGPALSSPISQAEPVTLTPAIIAKAQKHCRFAISSLDYEDAEQARKELRAALSVLGG